MSADVVSKMGRAILQGRSFWQDVQSNRRAVSTDVYTFMAQVAVPLRQHPLAGGFFPVVCDHVSDYMELRRRTYGFELAPLPRSLRRAEAMAQAPAVHAA